MRKELEYAKKMTLIAKLYRMNLLFEKEFEKAKDIPPDKDYYEEFADKCENMETIVCDRDVESVETEEYVIDGRVPTNLDIRQEEILNELADKVPEPDIPDLED